MTGSAMNICSLGLQHSYMEGNGVADMLGLSSGFSKNCNSNDVLCFCRLMPLVWLSTQHCFNLRFEQVINYKKKWKRQKKVKSHITCTQSEYKLKKEFLFIEKMKTLRSRGPIDQSVSPAHSLLYFTNKSKHGQAETKCNSIPLP